jgi:hypothetical protein
VTFERTALAWFGRRLVDRTGLSSLNPQPIPPLTALNPQPLPPVEVGALVGRTLLDLGWTGLRLGIDPKPFSDEGDNPCGTPPVIRNLPPFIGWPKDPGGPPVMLELEEYYCGLVAVLSVAEGPLADSPFIRDSLEQAGRSLDVVRRNSLGQG